MALVERGQENTLNEQTVEEFQQVDKSSIFTTLKYVFFGLVILGILASLTFAWYKKSTTLVIDNPTASGITVQINTDKVIELAPYETKTVKYSAGTYSVKLNGKDVGTFEKKKTDSGNAFLNPTKDIYMKEYILYGEEEQAKELPNNEITVYEQPVYGPFDKVEGLYIDGDWSYSFNQQLPEEVKLSRANSYTIKTKLYRFEDFVEMYNSYYVIPEKVSGTGTSAKNK